MWPTTSSPRRDAEHVLPPSECPPVINVAEFFAEMLMKLRVVDNLCLIAINIRPRVRSARIEFHAANLELGQLDRA